jgi:hypothetical protein
MVFKSPKQRKAVMAKLGKTYYINPYTGKILRNLNDAKKLVRNEDYPPHIGKAEIVRIVKQFKRTNPPRIFHHTSGKKREYYYVSN